MALDRSISYLSFIIWTKCTKLTWPVISRLCHSVSSYLDLISQTTQVPWWPFERTSFSEILVSHGGEEVGCGLWGCDAVSSWRWLPAFRRKVSLPSSEVNLNTSALKMEALRSPEPLVTSYKTTRRNNPEDYNRELNFDPISKETIEQKCK
jgi:hypothetical protein